MKEYLLVFRAIEGANRRNDAERIVSMEEWKNWIGSIAATGKFIGGQPLQAGGRLMTNTGITDAPFAEGKEVLNGYVILKADDYKEAEQFSKGCPIFQDKGGSLEIREIAKMEM